MNSNVRSCAHEVVCSDSHSRNRAGTCAVAALTTHALAATNPGHMNHLTLRMN